MTPDTVKTKYLGTLKFTDGRPTKKTADKLYDHLACLSAIEVFLNWMPAASIEAMRMDLLSLAGSAVLLVATITTQVILTTLFAAHIVFRMMGRDYDAAMVVGGYIGLGLEATPVAIASMAAVSKKHGPSVKDLLIVTLVGAFFIDLVNAVTIYGFLKLPFMQ